MAKTRTLLFCTSYGESAFAWNTRYSTWHLGVLESGIDFDFLLIADDESPVLPAWHDWTVMHSVEGPPPPPSSVASNKLLYQFKGHLGKVGVSDYPGWYRSFAFCLAYAAENAFGKIIYIESDAFIISRRLVAFVNAAASSWTTFWCPLHAFPEMGIQVIGGDAIERAAGFFRQPYENLRHAVLERTIPFSCVDTLYVGNRYGEIPADIPPGADFAVQVEAGRERAYYWWLTDAAMRAVPERLIALRFGFEGDAGAWLGQGWSGAEDRGTWMEDFRSEILLAELPRRSGYRLSIEADPFLAPPGLGGQRLSVDVNGHPVGQLCCAFGQTLTFEIPAAVTIDGRNTLGFVHPDAERPCNVQLGSDRRLLSFFVKRIWVDSTGG